MAQKLTPFAVRQPALAFGDVADDGDNRASQLLR